MIFWHLHLTNCPPIKNDRKTHTHFIFIFVDTCPGQGQMVTRGTSGDLEGEWANIGHGRLAARRVLWVEL